MKSHAINQTEHLRGISNSLERLSQKSCNALLAVVLVLALGLACDTSFAQTLNGQYQILAKMGQDRNLRIGVKDRVLGLSRSTGSGNSSPALFYVAPVGSGYYEIRENDAQGTRLHENGNVDKLISVRWNVDDDFTKFKLEKQSDGSFRVRTKATNQYWHLNANGDKLVSTRWQPGDVYTLFEFQPSQSTGSPNGQTMAANSKQGASALASNRSSSNPLLDKAGYPINEVTHKGDIVFSPIENQHDRFGWSDIPARQFDKYYKPQGSTIPNTKIPVSELRKLTLVLPNVKSKVTGRWRLISQVNNRKDEPDAAEFSLANSLSISQEVSAQIEVGFGASLTAGVMPFGVGAELTLDSSISFAAGVALGTERGRENGSSKPVQPGRLGYAWERAVKTKTSFDASKMFEPYANQGDRSLHQKYERRPFLSSQEKFYVMMARSYGSLLWPDDMRKLDERAMYHSRRHGNYEAGYWDALKDPNDIKASGDTIYGLKVMTLKNLFDYQGFRQIGYQEVEFEMPASEFFFSFTDSPSN